MMRQSEYLWVVVQRTNTRSKSKSMKKNLSRQSRGNKITQNTKCLVKNSERERSVSKQKQNLKKMAELEKQNRMLRKQNQVLREYFYTMGKGEAQRERRRNQNNGDERQQNPLLVQQTFSQPQGFVQHSHYSKISESLDKAEQRGEVTTVHSYEGNGHKIYSFGRNGN